MPISSHELKHFLNDCFVECGSAALGWGISSALIAGFKKIYSVEINPESYEQCKQIFKDDKRVHLDLGDCGKWLDVKLNELNQPCTIYLDANGWINETESPFHVSIDALVRHGKQHHILLVDDMNHGKRSRAELIQDCRDSQIKGDDIISQLKRVNPDYCFYLIDTHMEDLSHMFPSWVLVADPIKNRFPDMSPAEIIT